MSCTEATRTSANVHELDLHSPNLEEESRAQTLSPDDGYVLHFDCCGLDSFRTKWRRRFEGVAPLNRMRESRSRQGEELKRRMGDEGKVKELYERLYFLSGHERLMLRALGLLKKIDIDIPEVKT